MRINKDDSILIIGGGLSGLFTALALQHEGYESVKLLHKDQELNWPETPVQLGAHLFPLLTAFGLVDELKTLGTPWTQGGFKAKNGKEVQNLDLDRISNMVGFKPHLIPASTLLKLIKDRLKPGTLQGKADFISYTQNEKQIQAHFLDGNSETHEFMIGADGENSRVRLQMLGEVSPKTEDLITWESVIEKSSLPEEIKGTLEEPCLDYVGPGQRVSILPMKEGKVGVAFTLKSTGPVDPRQAKEQLQASFSDWPQPVPEVVDKIWPASLVPRIHKDRDLSKQVFRERVMLVGYAAQPIMPFLGMEDSFEIESAITLVNQLNAQPKKVEKALQAYEKRMRTRASIYHKAGRRYANWLSVTQPLRYTLRNVLFQYLPERTTTAPFYKINLGK